MLVCGEFVGPIVGLTIGTDVEGKRVGFTVGEVETGEKLGNVVGIALGMLVLGLELGTTEGSLTFDGDLVGLKVVGFNKSYNSGKLSKNSR